MVLALEAVVPWVPGRNAPGPEAFIVSVGARSDRGQDPDLRVHRRPQARHRQPGDDPGDRGSGTGSVER